MTIAQVTKLGGGLGSREHDNTGYRAFSADFTVHQKCIVHG